MFKFQHAQDFLFSALPSRDLNFPLQDSLMIRRCAWKSDPPGFFSFSGVISISKLAIPHLHLPGPVSPNLGDSLVSTDIEPSINGPFGPMAQMTKC